MTKARLMICCVVLIASIFVCATLLAALLYKLLGTLTGEESLFISGILCAGVLGSYAAKKWKDKSILICFISTFVVSSLFAGLSFFMANIFETFLVPASFYVICLFGVMPCFFRKGSF